MAFICIRFVADCQYTCVIVYYFRNKVRNWDEKARTSGLILLARWEQNLCYS